MSDTKNNQEQAVKRFMTSMHCSQAILSTYSPAMGLPAEHARRIAAAFAGGMGIGSACGAVTGALMVIGLKYGNSHKETSEKTKTFLREFETTNGAIECSRLLGANMGTPEGVEEAQGKGYFTELCPNFVRSAAEILDRLLE